MKSFTIEQNGHRVNVTVSVIPFADRHGKPYGQTVVAECDGHRITKFHELKPTPERTADSTLAELREIVWAAADEAVGHAAAARHLELIHGAGFDLAKAMTQ